MSSGATEAANSRAGAKKTIKLPVYLKESGANATRRPAIFRDAKAASFNDYTGWAGAAVLLLSRHV